MTALHVLATCSKCNVHRSFSAYCQALYTLIYNRLTCVLVAEGGGFHQLS